MDADDVGYLSRLTIPRTVLWCYLLWFLYAAARYFDPSVRLWLSSLGIAAIIGTGLYLSTAYGTSARTRLGARVGAAPPRAPRV